MGKSVKTLKTKQCDAFVIVVKALQPAQWAVA